MNIDLLCVKPDPMCEHFFKGYFMLSTKICSKDNWKWMPKWLFYLTISKKLECEQIKRLYYPILNIN